MSEPYEGREQSQVKHHVLQKYLQRFAHIIGSKVANQIVYVDGFSGPWNTQSSNFSDSSFAIALNELRKAKTTLSAKQNKVLDLNCFFIEKDQAAYRDLDAYARGVTDASVRTRNASLGEAVPDIVDFVKECGASSFPFVFLDPKGWTGLELDLIAPLLRLNPGEVLVNFMTSFIRRFIKSPDPATQRSFDRLYGKFRPDVAALQRLQSEDLDDALVEAYAELLRAVGGFQHVCKAIVLHPDVDSTHFHLIYGTRSPKGVEVFKEAERAAMSLQDVRRAEAKSRRRAEQTGPELFSAQIMDDPAHVRALRERYREKARAALIHELRSGTTVPFDRLWLIALYYPMVQESDVKEWVLNWQANGIIELLGMRERQRVPQRGNRIVVRAVAPERLA